VGRSIFRDTECVITCQTGFGLLGTRCNRLLDLLESALDALIGTLRICLNLLLDEVEIGSDEIYGVSRILIILFACARVFPGTANERFQPIVVDCRGVPVSTFAAEMWRYFVLLIVLLAFSLLLLLLWRWFRFFFLAAEPVWEATAERGNKPPVEQIKRPLLFFRIRIGQCFADLIG
jgi:hypothetical protein